MIPMAPLNIGNSLQSLLQFAQTAFKSLNNLSFGDTIKNDNFNGFWLKVTTPAVANTEFAVPHKLGRVPIGWLEFRKNKAAHVYDSGTAWTTSNIFLKCDVASVNIVIFVL